jgi:hypothetical protein
MPAAKHSLDTAHRGALRSRGSLDVWHQRLITSSTRLMGSIGDRIASIDGLSALEKRSPACPEGRTRRSG